MHINIVTFQPGGAITFPETHVMEHGLYVLEGKAVYLLNRDWVEVQAGDFMWLRAFCPQACYAGGPGRFRYLLYKGRIINTAIQVGMPTIYYSGWWWRKTADYWPLPITIKLPGRICPANINGILPCILITIGGGLERPFMNTFNKPCSSRNQPPRSLSQVRGKINRRVFAF
jgi:hypothetical protein